MLTSLSIISTTLHPDLLLTGLCLLVFAVTAVYSAAVPQGGRRWWLAGGLLAALIIVALQVTSLARMILLDLAALAAVGLVWSQPGEQARSAARGYLGMLALSILCSTAGLALGGLLSVENTVPPVAPLDTIAAGLIVAGFAMKLALVPVYFWLPRVAAATSPMTTALIVGTLDMAELGELIHLRTAAPWIFTGHHTLWLALALLSMFGGALLALAQRDLKRMLAFSTIDDMGYLLLGVLVGSQLSLTGVLLGAASHAVFKLLMFGAVGIAERAIGEPVTFDCRGLAAHFPISSAMFITGVVGILGIPPLFGFAGRWRLYLAGLQSGGPALALTMAAATGLALLYYVRAIHAVWLGRAPGAPVDPRSAEPRPATAVLVALAVLALLLGLFPAVLQAAI